MQAAIQREKVRFLSGGTTCAAWHYPGTNGACVIMAAGLAVTKEPGTDPFATRFAQAGFGVLAFDYRRLGESGGQPRQIVRIGEQLDDWQAAIRFARTLRGVDPERIAIWGFSITGGHIFRVAARNPDLAAAIAHSPSADGLEAMRNAMRQWSVMTMNRLTLLGLWDAIGGRFGRDPILVPLTGPRGMVVSLGTPDAQNGPRALNPGNKYPDWQQQIAARSAARVAFYRPGRAASRTQIPLLVLAYDDDGVTPAPPTAQAGHRAPRGEVIRRPGGHYEAFMDGHEEAAEVLLSFLGRHLLDDSHTVQAPGTLPAAEVAGA